MPVVHAEDSVQQQVEHAAERHTFDLGASLRGSAETVRIENGLSQF